MTQLSTQKEREILNWLYPTKGHLKRPSITFHRQVIATLLHLLVIIKPEEIHLQFNVVA